MRDYNYFRPTAQHSERKTLRDFYYEYLTECDSEEKNRRKQMINIIYYATMIAGAIALVHCLFKIVDKIEGK